MPIPTAAQWVNNYFLHANGTWQIPVTPNTSPGGPNTAIQFNDSGAFGGNAFFTFDTTTLVVKLSNTTSNASLTIPTTTQWSGDVYLHANGTWSFPKTVPENPQNNTAYTFALSDAGVMVTGANASAITWTVPNNSSVAFMTGTRIDLLQTGAGQITIANAASGVTVLSSGSKKKLTGQYSGGTLWKQNTSTWYLLGDISS